MLQRLLVLGGALVLVTACGPSTSPESGTATPGASSPPAASSPPSPSESAAPTAPATPSRAESARPRPGTRIRVADSDVGPMLFAASGQAIYLFAKEQGPRAECYGACAAAWPPVLTDGEPRAVRGARPALLGTTKRRDGSRQVTYDGHPLYFYAHEGPWQVLCHDVVEYGGTWLVVRPDGDPAP